MRITDQRALPVLVVLTIASMLLVTIPATAQTGPQLTGSSSQVFLPLAVLASPTNPLEQQVVDLTNQLRHQHNCPALRISPQLTTAARGHSQDMADNNYFSHDDLAGHTAQWRAQQAGYRGLAGWENIAAGYSTAREVVSAWYNETPPNDGHRRNILDCSLTDIGVGYGYNGGSAYGSYWTQDFGRQ